MVIIAIITLFSDCVSGESNAVGRVRLSARPFVSTVNLSSETVDLPLDLIFNAMHVPEMRMHNMRLTGFS